MSFHATATKVGNSKGLRLDAALYRDHLQSAFLAFMDQQMSSNPALFTPLDSAQSALIASLVEGVDADDDTEFPADFRMP